MICFTFFFLGLGQTAYSQHSFVSTTSPDVSVLDQYDFDMEANDVVSVLNQEVAKIKADRNQNSDELYKSIKTNFVGNILNGLQTSPNASVQEVVYNSFYATSKYSSRFNLTGNAFNRAIEDVASLIH